ncbi:MAG: Holliday junction branch migration protein RuvA, partial [Alistipes sp.]|nr:Holliday junction branch migration protein RuvA [Alistipes sp.]
LLKNVKGLGLKTAQKIIVELTGKMVDLATTDTPTTSSADTDEALAALQMLGFAKTAAEKALQAILKEQPSAPVEELVRLALKRL